MSGYQQVLHSHGQQCLSCEFAKDFCQNAFASGALPRTPLGDLQRPQTPSWKRLGYTPIRPIGVNRPAFGGTVPHFHQMSRGPAQSADVPHFSKMVLLFFPLPINDPILHVCLATQQSDELRIKIGKDRFRIRTPTAGPLIINTL